MYVGAHVSLDPSQRVHPSVILLMYISDDCVCTCPSLASAHRAVRLAVRLVRSTHLGVIMKATFDFNLS